MYRTLFITLAFFLLSDAQAQTGLKNKKYPSLLWEISGPGNRKPSYLIGTMHVSSKLAFNLPDSFYIALRNAQVVALETNPETWQEDMSKYDFDDDPDGYADRQFQRSLPTDYLSISTLKFYRYDSKIERSLYSNPSTINNLLYRSYGNESNDFEEDTYLDMYIFQCGKKWGKKVAGVEDYGESMRLMAEAYQDATKDKDRKERSYDDMSEDYSFDKLQEAYRTGNLDLLDSINRYNSFSSAFDEKFLYRRNEIQAHNIDSIIRSGSTLFVGVGAAHLPGERGVIEMLRRKGYKVRPIRMGERASREKDLVDKIRVPVVFRTETSEDGFYKVDIPGKFYKFGEDAALDQKQYSDMANGSYYMVTRIMTNAWMWSHTTDDVYRRLDSLLYENVPGKIITKTAITRNGYKGLDITNRTRRGDLQRYNIFITPFEILFFKMSGNGDYVKFGEEARKFFGSIQLKEFRASTDNGNGNWIKYNPPAGGYSAELPHAPYIGNDGSWIFDAADRTTQNYFRIVRTDIHNYNFLGEDSFDLVLMDESFMASEFIDSNISRKQVRYRGYPAMDASYRDKNGAIYKTRFLIQGPHYYTLIAYGPRVNPAMDRFLNSFEIRPFSYGKEKEERDTTLYFTVKTPVTGKNEEKIKLDIPRFSYYLPEDEEEKEDEIGAGAFRDRLIKNDTTGESVYIYLMRAGRYLHVKDSLTLEQRLERAVFDDSTMIVRKKNSFTDNKQFRVWEKMISDSGSSRMFWEKTFYRKGIGVVIATQTDTLTPPSAFLKTFFETFNPFDTIQGTDPLVHKSAYFFEDFRSGDSVVHKRAVDNISAVKLDSTDLPGLIRLVKQLSWKEKNYLETKASLIDKFGDISTQASANYLRDLYFTLEDTIQLQYAVLENLLQQKTRYAYQVFRGIIAAEPPVIETTKYGYRSYSELWYDANNDNWSFFDELSDSLQLVKEILPDLLPLLNLDDYKSEIMELLGTLVDSNLVSTKDYESYFSKFLVEARQELKRQSINEKKKAIEKAEEEKNKKTESPYADDDRDKGNDDLDLYAKLLLPWWDVNPQVQTLVTQMLRSSDKQLKYATLLLLIRSDKTYPDSLLDYFGSLDEYRYELYSDLRASKKLGKFPAQYNNHLDLGRSALLQKSTYTRPDSVVFVERINASYKGVNGFIYFFKVKTKKDDVNWKLATVGLVPEDPSKFEVEVSEAAYLVSPLIPRVAMSRFDFTGFTDIRLKEDMDTMSQLKKMVKKMLYSRRNSARDFYQNEDNEPGSGSVHID